MIQQSIKTFTHFIEFEHALSNINLELKPFIDLYAYESKKYIYQFTPGFENNRRFIALRIQMKI
jgi:hypothetical protein